MFHVKHDDAFDTPIAREALQAVQVRNVRQEALAAPGRSAGSSPSPTRRAASARRPARSTSRRRWPCTACGCCVIDLDPQGNASTALGVDHPVGTPSIYDVLLGGRPLAEVAQPVELAPTRCAASRPPSTWPAPTSS